MASEGDEHHQHHHNWWDVFLSFAGKDTRNGFVDHLYSALEKSWILTDKKGILTFKDDEKLQRGEPISHTLLKAIEESMVAVVVFSKNYASSRWCLDELVKIMDCHRRCSSSSSCNSSSMPLGPKTVVVIPIFYHVDPSDVRNPIKNGYFGGDIISGQHDPARVEIWRKALEEAGNLAGHVVNDTINSHEAKFIGTLVKEIWHKLPDSISSEERLFGMESHIEEVISLLDAESDDVRFVGIWGLSGIGKTTLAKAIFHRMRNQFQVACFLEQVGEEGHGLRHLEKQLVNYLKINNDCEGNKIMSRLRSISVLLVLDDVDGVDIDQLNVFFRKLRLFGPGSKILITTRNKHLLVHEVDEKNIYEAKLLNDGEAIRLFSRMAFKHIHPTREFEHLSYKVIKYANGLPLALKVLGRALYSRKLNFWKDTLEKLRKYGDGDIHKKLKIGFDDLDRIVQETFLDIACIFEGMEKEHVTRILDSFDFCPGHSIEILIDKSLISVSEGNTLRMHNLIREMGRRIDREKPRRLWDTNDFERLLKCSTDLENIECILLHPPDLEGKCMDIKTEALRKMPKLRLLVVCNVRSRQAPKYLSSELRWLIWNEFPSESLPAKAYNLVGLELHHSNIKRLWKGKEMMDKLKHINLSSSPLIESTPDFTSTPNLEVLILCYCKNLKVVHQSLGALERLVRIDLYGCENLKTFPNFTSTPNLEVLILHKCRNLKVVHQSLGALERLVCLDLYGCKNLKTFPNSIHSKSLQIFKLSGCKKLQNFPEIPVIMEHLSELDLSETGIRELPSSIEHLPNLESLNLIDCKNFASLPGTFCKLKRLTSLYLGGCSKLDKLPEELGNLECLKALVVEGTGIKEVPSSIEHLSGLKSLSLKDCKNLRSLPSAICKLKRLRCLNLSGCSELEKLPEELGSLECLTMLQLNGTAITQPPRYIRFLNNLMGLDFSRSSQSRTSILQFLFNRKRKRQEDDSTWSLVLPFALGLRSLASLRLASCNMLDGAIPGDLESCSFLTSLDLGGNCFVQLPSLNQLSKLRTLYLDGCKMLEALPELPSSISVLSADDCPSLRLSVDRITNCRKLYKVSFSNCLQLLKEYNGESKSEAVSTLWQHMIEVSQSFYYRELSIILPGGDIPKWFSKQTTGGHSISLELPSNWYNNFKGVGLCVAFDEAPFKYFGRREKVPAGVCVQITVTNRHSNLQYGVHHYDDKYSDLASRLLGREINIIMENVSFAYIRWPRRTDIHDWCEMEVSIKNSRPNTARVTKWGMGLLPKYQTI